ncbi:MAG: PDZ domain-containing protein [Saprospiraceae bacterium]|nr:PDZ domain-containing protein [Saprospiraceae bacterium]
MIKNYMTTCILAFFCAFSISQLSAQDNKEVKKVVVIEKVTDENGKVVEKKIVKEGAEADAFAKKMKWQSEDGTEIKIRVQSDSSKVIERKAYKFVSKDDEGNEQVFEWEGEGEMPEEMKQLLEENNIDVEMEMEFNEEFEGKEIDIDEVIDSENIKHINVIKTDGDEKRIEIMLKGDEVPEDVEKMLEEENIFIMMNDGEDGEVEVIVRSGDKSNSNKAQLGVLIEKADNGVGVIDVMEGTAAEAAGMQKGDVIQKINDVPVKSIDDLLTALKPFKPGDSVVVEGERDGENIFFEATLKERNTDYDLNTWEEAIEGEEIIHEIHEEHKDGKKVIKKKVIIKKDDK